jgi:hypothetical protein
VHLDLPPTLDRPDAVVLVFFLTKKGRGRNEPQTLQARVDHQPVARSRNWTYPECWRPEGDAIHEKVWINLRRTLTINRHRTKKAPTSLVLRIQRDTSPLSASFIPEFPIDLA